MAILKKNVKSDQWVIKCTKLSQSDASDKIE